MSQLLGRSDPRALAAEKSRVREERRWIARMRATQDFYLAKVNALWRAMDKAMRREAAETVRANYWRTKARALKRELRDLRETRRSLLVKPVDVVPATSIERMDVGAAAYHAGETRP